MPEFILRLGTPADVEAMHELDLLCFDKPFRFDRKSMRKYATHPEAIVVIAESDGELRGFIVVNPTKRRAMHAAYITTLDVHPEFRRSGIARALVAEAEQRALSAGAATMHLHVYTENLSAISFYQAAGYEQLLLTEDFYNTGLHAYAYLKSL